MSIQGAGEIVHWLRALASFPEGLGWIPSAHMMAYNHLYPQKCPLLASVGIKHMQVKHS